MKLPCPYCGDSIEYDGVLAGKTFRCRYCKKPLRMPLVTELAPEDRVEYEIEQEELRKRVEAAERERRLAQQKEAERKQAEYLAQQEHERRAREEQLRAAAEAAQQQQYLQAVADAKADPERPKIWHCCIEGTEHGPMRESVLQKWIDDGALGGHDYVRLENAPIWIQLSDIPERFALPASIVAPVPAGDDRLRCPKCRCTQLSAHKRGMKGSTACLGALLLGPLGVLCGLKGANQVIVTCLKCGHQWTRGR